MTTALLLATLITLTSYAETPEPASDPEPLRDELAVPALPPPFSPGIYPCSGCHAAMTPNPTRRDLGFHSEIQLAHGPREGWCFECHDVEDRDHLHRANGARVEFTSSYLLCGQCHGPKLRDWRAGVHGKRTGQWNGEKEYLLCVHCHNPHAPHFAPLAPEPRPLWPGENSPGPDPEDEAPPQAESDHD